MSASEYLPLYQSFTNRTHIRNGRRFDQSNISQTIEKNICCGVILSRNVCGYVNLPITYILVTICPADGITSCCPIWIDTIKKWISIKIWRAFVQYKGVCVVDTVWWLSFGLPQKDHLRQRLYNIEQIVWSSKAHPPPQIEGRWTVIKVITLGKAQWTKWLPKSIFYRWYD